MCPRSDRAAGMPVVTHRSGIHVRQYGFMEWIIELERDECSPRS